MASYNKIVIRGRVMALWPFLALAISLSNAAINDFEIPENAMCACPGDMLTFTCTIVGGGATVWSGTALECALRDIVLRHDIFKQGIVSYCDGAIVIESVGIEGNCYISLLNITASAQFDNKSTECLVNDAGTSSIGDSIITLVPVSTYLQEPIQANVLDVNMKAITFTLIPMKSTCPQSITYNIMSNCTVTCRNATGNKVICSDLLIPSICTFSIQSVVCGQTGVVSNPIRVTLKVPNEPQVDIVLVYSASTGSLIRFMITVEQEPLFSIADGIPGSVTHYTLTYSNITSSKLACRNITCDYMIDVASSNCSQFTDIEVTLSASNRLGQGPASAPITIGCSNQIVEVQYNSTTSTIVCAFLDKMDASNKSCSVKYGKCDQMLNYNARGNNTVEAPNNITLTVNPEHFGCYEITARSANITIIVEGRTSMSTDADSKNTKTVIAVVFASLGVIIPVIILIIGVMTFKKRVPKKELQTTSRVSSQEEDKNVLCSSVEQLSRGEHGHQHAVNSSSWSEYEIHRAQNQKFYKSYITKTMKQFHLKEVSKERFKAFEIGKDYELKDFITNELKREFKIGHTFYEFQREIEPICEHKEVIFIHEKAGEFLSSEPGCERQFMASGVALRQSFKEFKIFVQSTGSGVRLLEAGTIVLYDMQDCLHVTPRAPLKTILSDQFEVKQLTEKLKINCEASHMDNIFVDVESYMSLIRERSLSVHDVILKDKQTRLLHCGPLAHEMVEDYIDCSTPPDHKKWEIFILSKFKGDMDLQPGTLVLQQNPDYMPGEFVELTVDGDDVKMSKFIKNKGYKFKNGCVYYEFSQEEQDLQYYKEVVYLSIENNESQFHSNVNFFYAIPGTPCMHAKPGPKPSGVDKVFIQSTSEGTRYLKKGTKLLLKTETVSSV